MVVDFLKFFLVRLLTTQTYYRWSINGAQTTQVGFSGSEIIYIHPRWIVTQLQIGYW